MEKKWYIEVKKADFEKTAKRFNISPVMARLLCNRGLTGEDEIAMFLNGTREDMYNPFMMKDMDNAVSLVKECIEEGKKIRVIGDYDIDGVCAAYILRRGLACAIERIRSECPVNEKGLPDMLDVVIPNRMKDGYGINSDLVLQAEEDGVDLIITCDNGIAAYWQVVRAKDLGMHVIITDHHEVPYNFLCNGDKELMFPPADAVIDPRREDCKYPFKSLCGAMVAYKFIQGLFMMMRLEKEALEEEEEERILEECFAFGAFATVGDVMELTGENHVIIKYGLKAIENCENLGMQALIECCGLKDKELTVYHLGFVLGPCINASGRLERADRAMDLFCASSKEEAMKFATRLKELNSRRQELTRRGLEEAIEIVEENPYAIGRILVVYMPYLHESLAGIIAGRLRERYYRPVFVLTNGKDCIKGSGRSIEAYNMVEEMCKIRDCFLEYGGHRLAAGCTLPFNTVNHFANTINRSCMLEDEDLTPKVMIDVPMPLDYVTFELVEQMKLLEPYGTGNRQPLFAQKDVTFEKGRIFGKNCNVVRGTVKSPDGAAFAAIYFGDGKEFMENVEKWGRMDIVYTPMVNVFRGRERIQIEIKYVRFGMGETE